MLLVRECLHHAAHKGVLANKLNSSAYKICTSINMKITIHVYMVDVLLSYISTRNKDHGYKSKETTVVHLYTCRYSSDHLIPVIQCPL